MSESEPDATTYDFLPWLGLRDARGVVCTPPAVSEMLRERWERASEEDRFDLARDLAAQVILLAQRKAWFEADLPLPDDQKRVFDESRSAVRALTEREGKVFEGDLHPRLLVALLDCSQIVLSVYVSRDLVAYVSDSVDEGVHLLPATDLPTLHATVGGAAQYI